MEEDEGAGTPTRHIPMKGRAGWPAGWMAGWPRDEKTPHRQLRAFTRCICIV